MKEHKANREFIGFTLISGLISFGYNVVMTVIPLRMVDHGLSYSKIGSAMSAVAIGLMVIKLLIGHLSDMLGTKNYYEVAANNVNHPNDFIHRFYAMNILCAIFDFQSFAQE